MRLWGIAPARIRKILCGSCKGTVDMVNSRGIYLEFDGTKILLCDASFGVVPNGVSVENWQLLPPLLEVGQQVLAEGGKLHFPSWTAQLQLQSAEDDTTCFSPASQQWEAALSLLRGRDQQTGLAPLVHSFFGDGESPLNPWCGAALAPLQALLASLEEEDLAAIPSSLGALLGLGVGLTPSGDDVLCGLLYGLRHSVLRNTAVCAALTDAVVTQAAARTTAVSAHVLVALAQDAPFERMKAAWQNPAQNAAALMEIGSSSGSEMLLGLVLAARLLKKKG